MVANETLTGMSLEEFMRRWHEDGAFELIDGKVIPFVPNVFGHDRAANHLMFLLNRHSTLEAFIKLPFVIYAHTDWLKCVYVPDVAFVKAERLAEYQASHADWQTLPLPLIPDLISEVVSPTDLYIEVIKKVRGYFRVGVPLVWLVDPFNRQIMAFTAANPKQQITLSEDETLTGGAVLPGLEIQVKAIFD